MILSAYFINNKNAKNDYTRKMKNTIYLVMQNTYDAIEVGLYNNERCIELVSESKINAGKMTVPLVSSLLEKNKCTFSELAFIGVNQGPAPFTTLRIIIATANGFAFATNLPLVGVDGLRALLEQHRDCNYAVTVALLDAFNKDVYVGIDCNGQIVYTGCQTIEEALRQIKTDYPEHKLRFVGAGSVMYADMIHAELHNRAVIVAEGQVCSLDHLAKLARAQWDVNQGISSQVFPLYLKQQHYKNQFGQLKKV